MIEVLTIIGLLSVIYFLFNLYQDETMKRDLKNKQNEYARGLISNYTTYKWNYLIVDRSYMPIQEQIRGGIKPEHFKFSLEIPDEHGFFSVVHYDGRGWRTYYYPNDKTIKVDYLLISLKESQLLDCLRVAERVYKRRIGNNSLSLEELLSDLHK